LVAFFFSRREPGDWPCQQCNEFNFKSRVACRRCSAPRNQPAQPNAAAATGTTPQVVPKQGDWTCHSCNNLNFAARTACHKCGRQKQTLAASNTPPSVTPKSGDWTCQFCNMTNFASRVACRQCNRQQPQPMIIDTPPAATSKPGDWKCPSCPEMNFGSRGVCRSCGAARVSAENNNNKKECVICMENPIDSVITTCGHSAVCLPCGALITQCPICRNDFNQQQIIKFYNVHE
jgi:hypothetical protein